jgi:hypothetical protein
MGMFPLQTDISTSLAKKISAREEEAYLALRSHGYSDKTVAAIMANMKQEQSRFDYTDDSGSKKAVGVFQLLGSKLKAYKDYLKEYNLKDSMENQIDYMVATVEDNYKGEIPDKYQLIGHGNTRELRNSFDNDGMFGQVTNFMQLYENPGSEEMELNKRFKNAKDYRKAIEKSY